MLKRCAAHLAAAPAQPRCLRRNLHDPRSRHDRYQAQLQMPRHHSIFFVYSCIFFDSSLCFFICSYIPWLLASPGGSRRPQEAPGGPWRLQENHWRPQEAPGDPTRPRRPQEVPGGPRRLQEAPEDTRRRAPGGPRRPQETPQGPGGPRRLQEAP